MQLCRGEIIEGLRRAFRFEIIGRRRHDRLERRGETDGDHILRDHAAKPHAGVEPARDNVGQRVVAGNLDNEIGIAPGKRCKNWRDGER